MDSDRVTLRSHREALAGNPNACDSDLSRVRRTAVHHIKLAGFPRVTLTRCAPRVDKLVDLIFDTQGRRPFFHVDGPLPFCWNAPKDWDKNYIRYEWGHLLSRNQNANPNDIENLCLQSARCNQHIQTSMNIEEVLEWLEGSLIAARVRVILERRQRLFTSPTWRDLREHLTQYR